MFKAGFVLTLAGLQFNPLFWFGTSVNSFLYSFQIIFCFKTTENITFIDPDKISRNMLRICLHARDNGIQAGV